MMAFAPVEFVLGMAINLHSADEKIWGIQFSDVQILFNIALASWLFSAFMIFIYACFKGARYGVWYVLCILIAFYLCGPAIRADSTTSRLLLPITIDFGIIFGIGVDEVTGGRALGALLERLLSIRGRGASGQDLEMGSVNPAGANDPSSGSGE